MSYLRILNLNNMKITNFTSPRGNVVPNQFEINFNDVSIFQSYDSIITKIEKGITYLDEKYWNYSKTTSKYRSIFLRESTKETQRKIDSGEYILTDLSKEMEIKGTTKTFKFFKK